MNIIIINSLGNDYLRDCINSLLTTTDKKFPINIVLEKDSREETLNQAIHQFRGDDLFIVADDIIFTPGWYEALEKNLENAEIIGFQMLYPKTDIVQDNGYDLISIDGTPTSMSPHKDLSKRKVALQTRYCDAVCGCCMFIKQEVFAEVPWFDKDGANRWGEMLFCLRAKDAGFRILVADHYLYHHGKSTKKDGDFSFSYEKVLWKHIVAKYLASRKLSEYTSDVSLVIEFINNKSYKPLIYGAGSVMELVNLKGTIAADICSGLIQEKGRIFWGTKIMHLDEVNFKDYDNILITVVGAEEAIATDLMSRGALHNNIHYVNKKIEQDNIIYEVKEYV